MNTTEQWFQQNINAKFGYYTVIGISENKKSILAQCICGVIKEKRYISLKNQKAKSCGCMRKQLCEETFLKKYGTKEVLSLKVTRDKIKKTCFEKYGVESNLSVKEVREKIQKTCNDRYGGNTPMSDTDVVDRVKQTIKDRYNVDSPLQNPDIMDKKKQTCTDKYGTDHPWRLEDIREKSKKTLLKNYNVDSPLQNPDIMDKKNNTCIDRYGVIHASQLPETNEKMIQTKINNNQIRTYNGQLLSTIAADKNISTSCLNKLWNETNSIESVLNARKGFSNLEAIIKSLLNSVNVKFVGNNKLGTFRPDFRIDNKLIIEADGEYWHSDRTKTKTYHRDRLRNAEENGYTLIAFHGTEITNQFPIVESIIKNKLGMSNRIWARKTTVKEVSKKEAASFFQDNHLMGKGKGKAYGLYFENQLVSCIRLVKKKDGLDISRFAHVLNTNVVGGFSKLLKHIERNLNPAFIQTFIDRRYGQGGYLGSLGFQKETESLSFCWYLKGQRYHRMAFPGNTGYDVGAVKIWDAGQAKWVKQLY